MCDGIKFVVWFWMLELNDNSMDMLEEEEKFFVILGENFLIEFLRN